jgi:hypothetical protein
MEDGANIMGSDLRWRVCPGRAMGIATVEPWLARLLQSLKRVPSDFGVDLSENPKLSLQMKSSLVCKAMPRISAWSYNLVQIRIRSLHGFWNSILKKSRPR